MSDEFFELLELLKPDELDEPKELEPLTTDHFYLYVENLFYYFIFSKKVVLFIIGVFFMSVIQKTIQLAGSKGENNFLALFDSGATYSCIKPEIAEKLEILTPLSKPMNFDTAKEGEKVTATERVTLDFYINGYRLSDEFMIIPTLSDEVIIGAASLQKWRIKLDFEHDEVIVDPRVTKLRLV